MNFEYKMKNYKNKKILYGYFKHMGKYIGGLFSP